MGVFLVDCTYELVDTGFGIVGRHQRAAKMFGIRHRAVYLAMMENWREVRRKSSFRGNALGNDNPL